jgi:hypothetical protein
MKLLPMFSRWARDINLQELNFMARIPFEPYGFAEHLIASGDYACADKHITHWNGIHWETLDDTPAESLALKWIGGTGITYHRSGTNAA